MKLCHSSKTTNITSNNLKLACSTATRLVQTAVTFLVLERRTVTWNSACIGKVLRPASSIKFFRDVLRSSSKYRTGTKHPRCTTRLSCSPSNNNKISTQKRISPIYQNFVVMQHSKLKFNKIQNWAQIFSSLRLLHSSTFYFPLHLPYSLPNTLLCLEPTFTRRTSGYRVGTK